MNSDLSSPEALREKWHPAPEEDFPALEKLYAAFTEHRPRRSAQTELSVRRVCRWTLEQERCVESKDYKSAQTLAGLIRSELDSDAMKDSLVSDQVPQLDDIVKALERNGVPIPDYEELCTILAGHSLHPTYPYTRDAADSMLLQILNTAALNEDRPLCRTLPEGCRVEDPLGEFAPLPDRQETALRDALGI